ncbi:MAG: hypothetical protein ACRDN9_17825 [Streptosporangiaceae bacterium]
MAASALASFSAAVAASFLGVYGTLAGAGLMAAVATAGTAVYQHYMERTTERLRGVHISVPRVRIPQGKFGRAARVSRDEGGKTSTAGVAEERKRSGYLSRLPGWFSARRRFLGYIGGGALAFVIALVAVTVIEAGAGSPMYQLVRGRADGPGTTSFGSAVRGTSDHGPQGHPDRGKAPMAPSQPSSTATASDRPSTSPSVKPSTPASPSTAPRTRPSPSPSAGSTSPVPERSGGPVASPQSSHSP